MNKSTMLELLNELNDRMRSQNIRGEITLYGGAVMCICLNARPSTGDIDALFEPKTKIYEISHQMAEEHLLPKNWLNDGVKGFVSSNDDVMIFDNLSNLDIYMTKPQYLFAMKCMACRIGMESNDIEDIKFLVGYIGIQSVIEAEEIIQKYFPANMILPKVHFMLTEILSN